MLGRGGGLSQFRRGLPAASAATVESDQSWLTTDVVMGSRPSCCRAADALACERDFRSTLMSGVRNTPVAGQSAPSGAGNANVWSAACTSRRHMVGERRHPLRCCPPLSVANFGFGHIAAVRSPAATVGNRCGHAGHQGYSGTRLV